MSFDVTTLALAKSYADQHSGGGGASTAGDFVIKMTVETDDDENYTVTSCDATIEQIDAAVAAEKKVVLMASYNAAVFELPMIQGVPGNTYYFGTFSSGRMIASFVRKVGENESNWQFLVTQIQAESVGYSNVALPNISTVGGALDELVPKSHEHANKSVLDKFAESDGKPTYDGQALGGGSAGDITAEDVGYTPSEDIRNEFPELAELESDTVKSGLDLAMYYAFAGMLAKNIGCDVQTATGTYTVELQGTLDGFVFPAALKAHEHVNKSVLDLISAADGKLQYNGSDVGLKGADGTDGKDGITPTIGANGNWYLDTTDTGKPSRGEKGDKGDPGSDANVTKANVITALGYTPEAVSAQVTTGSNITLADNTEYRLADVTTLTLTYPTGNFECWMRLNFAASGNVTVTLPTGTKYIGTAPDFKNGETWELSFKDKILAAQKVGEGT